MCLTALAAGSNQTGTRTDCLHLPTCAQGIESWLKTAGSLPVNVKLLLEGQEEVWQPCAFYLMLLSICIQHLHTVYALSSCTQHRQLGGDLALQQLSAFGLNIAVLPGRSAARICQISSGSTQTSSRQTMRSLLTADKSGVLHCQ